MQIIIEPHTLQRGAERGADESEIIDVLTNGIEEMQNKEDQQNQWHFCFNK